MNILPFTNNMSKYLKADNIIDYNDKNIIQLADSLFKKSNNEIDFVKLSYEFVRDEISHSADINNDIITYKASDVLKEKHGICFAKSHLLSAILRSKSIPAGFCYQKLILDDETAPVLIYHRLNGVYIDKKWIRLDARGNKKGVNAQFSVQKEQLAFPVRKEMNEEDNFIVYPNPDIEVLKCMINSRTRTELWNNLPNKLNYKGECNGNS